MAHEKALWVIGGLNGDVKARSGGPFTAGSSNPGVVERSPGGVGRNIAHSLALLEVPTVLVSAAGNDYEGDAVLAATADAGVDVSRVARLPGRRTGAYISLTDEAGELVGAVADMEVMQEITPAQLDFYGDQLTEAWGVIADTNLPPETLLRLSGLCAAAEIPLFVEPVSAAKAAVLNRGDIDAAWISPNRQELQQLFGLEAEELLARPDLLAERTGRPGMPRSGALLLSLGAEGAAIVRARSLRGTGAAGAGETAPWKAGLGESGGTVPWEAGGRLIRRPALPAEVADVNGAGDALLAGFAAALYRGAAEERALEEGLAAAAITVASPATVAPGLSPAAVEAKRREG